jgi:hypothetical protein
MYLKSFKLRLVKLSQFLLVEDVMKTFAQFPYSRFLLFGLFFFLFQGGILAQANWEPFIQEQQNFQKNAMFVIGGWGIANAITGGVGMFTTEGQTKYFHQMNAGWGVINAGIAAFGYYGSQQFGLEEPIGMSLLNKNLSLSKAFLFNTGLDVGYIVGGLYLRERAKTATELPERLRGFGNSVILQGSFLFTFDLIAYLLNNQHTVKIQDAIFNVGSTGNGIGVMIHF